VLSGAEHLLSKDRPKIWIELQHRKKYKKSEVLQNQKFENSIKLTWSDFLFLPQQRYTNFSI
jgi:hypothetical protein